MPAGQNRTLAVAALVTAVTLSLVGCSSGDLAALKTAAREIAAGSASAAERSQALERFASNNGAIQQARNESQLLNEDAALRRACGYAATGIGRSQEAYAAFQNLQDTVSSREDLSGVTAWSSAIIADIQDGANDPDAQRLTAAATGFKRAFCSS